MPTQVHRKIVRCNFGGSYFYDSEKKTWFYEYKKTEKGVIKLRKKLQAKTESLLKVKLDIFQKQLNDPNYGKASQSVANVTDAWYQADVANKVSIKTERDYQRNIGFIKEYLGNKDITKITIDDIELFQTTLCEKAGISKGGLSPRSVNAIIAQLSRIFVYAIRHKYITSDPTTGIKAIRNQTKDMIILSSDEVKHLLEVAQAGEFVRRKTKTGKIAKCTDAEEYNIKMHYVLLRIAFATGMRIGELRGLRVTDLKVDEKKINVAYQFRSSVFGKNLSKEQVDALKANAAKTKKTVDIRRAERANPFEEPKTANAKRTITINEPVMKELTDFLEYQREYAAKNPEFNNEWGLVFANSSGGVINESTFRNQYFSKLIKACGVDKNFTFHSIRHTHASLLILKKVPINIVSRRLGHADPSITLKVYTHILPNSDEEAADVWDEIMQ